METKCDRQEASSAGPGAGKVADGCVDNETETGNGAGPQGGNHVPLSFPDTQHELRLCRLEHDRTQGALESLMVMIFH